MTDITPQQALIEKVLKAATESGYVQKDSKHGQGYKYADDEAISEKFRTAMIANGVLVFPEELEFADIRVTQPEGEKTPQVLVSVRGFLAVTDGAASFKVASLGQGLDKGDKAIYKAMTGFKKYGYRHAVMMVTGDDPEAPRDDEVVSSGEKKSTRRNSSTKATEPKAEEANDPQTTLASRKQQDELKQLMADNGLTKDEMSVLRQAHTDKSKSSEFTVADYEAMKNAIVATGQVKEAAGEGSEVIQ